VTSSCNSREAVKASRAARACSAHSASGWSGVMPRTRSARRCGRTWSAVGARASKQAVGEEYKKLARRKRHAQLGEVQPWVAIAEQPAGTQGDRVDAAVGAAEQRRVVSRGGEDEFARGRLIGAVGQCYKHARWVVGG